MSEQNPSLDKPEMVSEPDTLTYAEIGRKKASIIQSIQKSEDKALLDEIYQLLQSGKAPEKSLNLSRQIDKV